LAVFGISKLSSLKIFSYSNGNVKFKGNFKRNKIHDQNAKIYDYNGHLAFEGDISAGKKNGYGKLFHPGGDLSFKGNFKEDKIHQKKAKLFYPKQDLVAVKTGTINYGFLKEFEGDLLEGKKEGLCKELILAKRFRQGFWNQWETCV
jgi:hypothetical protein